MSETKIQTVKPDQAQNKDFSYAAGVSQPVQLTGEPGVVTVTYSGPLPPPSAMAEYERVLPGAAERILVMAEKAAAHHQAIDVQAQKLIGQDVLRGQLLGFSIAAAGLLVSGYAIYKGYPAVAGAIVAAIMTGGVGVFVVGRK